MSDNKFELVPQRFHSITRSFSRTIQVQDFQPLQCFASHNEDIPLEEATPDKIKEISQKLFNMCVEEVREGIKQYLNEIKPNGKVN